jgi:hypothetical protein
MEKSVVEENARSRHRLEALLARLEDADFARTTSYGWTAGALLAHLAWWDGRVLALLRRWKAGGIDESPVDSEAINESLKPLCHAIEPHAAARLCLAVTGETDAEVESTSDELMQQILAGPTHFRFNRSLHRNDHIQDIEALLQEARPSHGS